MTVLASYHGIRIVSTPDTLGGVPRIDGHRIGVQHLSRFADDGDVDAALSAYPWLSEAQVKAAFEYYEDHPEEMEYFNRVNEDTNKYVESRRFKCICGEYLLDYPDFDNHVRTRDGDHDLDDVVFEGTLYCTCGKQFSDFPEFKEHQVGDKTWPRESHHHIEDVETSY